MAGDLCSNFLLDCTIRILQRELVLLSVEFRSARFLCLAFSQALKAILR